MSWARSMKLGFDKWNAVKSIAELIPQVQRSGSTFRLYHTFSDKNDYIVPKGTTDNLMDYNNGKELHKHQWDLVQDPQGMWFTGLIDEEEVAYYSESTDDTWTRNINKIACATLNSIAKVSLDDIAAGIKGVFELEGIGRIRFEIPEMDANKNDNLIDLKTMKTTEKTNYSDDSKYLEVVYKSVSKKYRVFFDVPIDKKSDFLAIINSPSADYFNNIIKEIPEKETKEVYSILSKLSECSYRYISTANRIKYLKWLTGEINMNEDQEEIIIKLLKYTNDKTALYNELYKKPLITAKMLDKSNEKNTKIILNELVKLCNKAWKDKTPQGVIYTGETSTTIGSDEHDAYYITHSKHIKGTNNWNVENYTGIFSNGLFEIGQVQQYPPVVNFECNALDPVCVYINNKPYILPMIYPAQLSKQLGNKKMFEQFIGSVTQIALIHGGARLVSALTPEIRMIVDYLKITPKSFATLFLADAGIQASINYILTRDWETALNRVDPFDAAFTGIVGNIVSVPLKSRQLLHLSKHGAKYTVCKQLENITKVATLEYVKVSFDYDLASNKMKMLCNNSEKNHEVMSRFLLALTAKWGADEIHRILKGWGSNTISQIENEGLDEISETIIKKVNNIIQTENAQKIINLGTKVFSEIITDLKEKDANIKFKVKEKKEIESFAIPDNTRVVEPLKIK